MIKSKAARIATNRLLTTSALVVLGTALSPNAAFALDDFATPTGGNVVGGSATISNPSLGQLNIQQASDRAVINWNSFDIGAKATTEFAQPGSNSLAVNRVTGEKSDPTQILGTLKANGRVMVLDRNGVIFGKSSKVDVGGIVASTGDVDTNEVLSGADKITITGADKGAVINEGDISIREGGIAGFVAPTVRNDGVIVAKMGKVTLAAGHQATVDLYGDNLLELAPGKEGQKALAENSGTIGAEGGLVVLTASQAKDVVDSVVNMSGVVDVSSATVKGGKIVLSGGKVTVKGKANANGKKAGSVSVRGKNIELSQGSAITANGDEAGFIQVLGDETVFVSGTLEALGSTGTGYIDTSAPSVDFGDGASILTSGEWLLDPVNITIDAARETLIENQLQVGNATVSTPLLGFQAGDINVNRTIDWNTAFTLTLTAINDIIFNSTSGGINATGAGNVVFNAGDDLRVLQGNGIKTNTGSFTANVDDEFEVATGQLIRTQGGLIRVISDFFALNGTLNAGLGEVYLTQDNDGGLFGFLDDEDFISVGDAGAGFGSGYHISQAELNRITADTLTIGNAAVSGDNQVRVRNANFSGFVQTNLNTRTPNSGTNENVLFDGANFAQNLTVRADDEIIFGANSSLTSTGDLVFNTDTNTGGVGSFSLRGNAKIDSNGNDITVNTLRVTLDSGAFIDAEGGNIDLNNSDIFFSADSNSLKTQGIGTIELNQFEGGSIQNAVNALANADSGFNTINVGAGEFLESVLVNKANTKLKGANAGVSPITAMRGNETVIKPNSPGFHVTADNVTVDGFTVANASDDGVFVDGGDNASILNNIITQSGRYGVQVVAGAGARIVGNSITQSSADGVLIKNNLSGTHAENINNSFVVGNIVDGTGANGIHSLNSNYVRVQGNNISNSKLDGLLVEGGKGARIGGLLLSEGNTITGTGDDGIEVRNSAGSQARNTTISNTVGNGIEVNGSNSVQLVSNVIFATGANGVSIVGSTGNRVRSNRIGMNAAGVAQGDNNIFGDGVYVDNANGVFIQGNKITQTARTGAWDVGSGIQVVNTTGATIGGSKVSQANTITSAGWDGIRVANSSKITVENNNIIGDATDNDARVGIWFGNVSQVNALNNKVTNANLGGGIYAEGGSDITFTGNNIDNSDEFGLLIRNAGGTNTISNNFVDGTGLVFKGFGTDGIGAYNVAGLTVSGNFIGTDGGNINGNGVTVENSASAQVTGNKIDNVTGNGIFIDPSNGSTVAGNVIKNAGANGIYSLNNTDITIKSNNISNSKLDGILVEGGSAATVGGSKMGDGNTITQSGRHGIDVLESNGVQILGNSVYGAGQNGINLHKLSDFTVSGNTIGADSKLKLSILGDGIFGRNLTDGSVTLNTIDLVGDDGVDLRRVDALEVSGNTISNSGDEGIFVGNLVGNLYVPEVSLEAISGIDADLKISGNGITNSGGNGIQVRGFDGIIDISNNKIDLADRDGIKVSQRRWSEESGEGSSLYVTDNVITNIGDDGIDLSGAGFAYVARNSVTNSQDDGIIISNINGFGFAPVEPVEEETQPELSGLETSDLEPSDPVLAPEAVVPAQPYGVIVEGNTVQSAEGDGIEVRYSTATLINNNTVTNVDEDGIATYGISGVSERLSFESKVGSDVEDQFGPQGVYAVVVTNNNVDQTGDDGVDVNNTTGRVRVAGNTITNSGFFSGKGESVFYAGYADENGADGITVTNTNLPLERYAEDQPVFDSNEQPLDLGVEEDGIAPLYAVEIVDNVVNTTGDDGVEVLYAPSVLVARNNTSENGVGRIISPIETGYEGGDRYGYGADGVSIRNIATNNKKWESKVLLDEETPYYQVYVDGNTIDTTGDDGVEVVTSGRTKIVNNTISNTGYEGDYTEGTSVEGSYYGGYYYGYYYYGEGQYFPGYYNPGTYVPGYELEGYYTGGEDQYGGDGIHVRGIEVEGESLDGSDVYVADNIINDAFDDGIEVFNVLGSVTVDSNDITTTGDDGIVVARVAAQTKINEDSQELPLNISVTGNVIVDAEQDGIEVNRFNGKALIDDNTVVNAGDDAVFVWQQNVEQEGMIERQEAIRISNYKSEDIFFPDFLFTGSSQVDITNNTILTAGDDGVDVSGVNFVTASGNVISDTQDDGINITSLFYNHFFSDSDGDEDMQVSLRGPLNGVITVADISGNVVSAAGGDGIQTTDISDLTVQDNIISDSGVRGFYVSGGENGDVEVSGNTFFNNPTSAEFESGLIDLTGDTNFFIGGNTALRFSPVEVLSFSEVEGLEATPTFSDLNLVNNTIGTSFFAGQSQFFVELNNGAFFNPGAPTLLNGLDATYLTPFGFVVPSATAGVISLNQFNFLESRFFHFTDDATLGLFFFGFVPGIQQEDLYNTFNPFASGSPNVNLTLLGLPSIPGARAAGGGNLGAFLNNLAPAAGDEENGNAGLSPEQLNAIETAAGEGSSSSCWSDALGASNQGQVSSLNFSTDPQQAVSEQAACGQQ